MPHAVQKPRRFPPMKSTPAETNTGYGTFTGVFVPTLLTILGVILYLRMG